MGDLGRGVVLASPGHLRMHAQSYYNQILIMSGGSVKSDFKRNLVLNEEIEAAFLVVKSQVYDKVILVFEMGDHVVVEMDQ